MGSKPIPQADESITFPEEIEVSFISGGLSIASHRDDALITSQVIGAQIVLHVFKRGRIASTYLVRPSADRVQVDFQINDYQDSIEETYDRLGEALHKKLDSVNEVKLPNASRFFEAYRTNPEMRNKLKDAARKSHSGRKHLRDITYRSYCTDMRTKAQRHFLRIALPRSPFLRICECSPRICRASEFPLGEKFRAETCEGDPERIFIQIRRMLRRSHLYSLRRRKPSIHASHWPATRFG
jgi:hypothetical protein